MNLDETTCLHCGKNKPGYCEECYQELIGENTKLQLELKRYKEDEPVTKEKIQEYLNTCIIFWRTKRDKENSEIAKYYIDAFQAVRDTFLGETLGVDEGSGEDQTAFIRFIPENLIKFKLAEAEREIKNTYYQGRRNGKTIERLALIGKIEAYKDLLSTNEGK